MKNSEIKIYKSQSGETSIEVKLERETVWLSQKQMAELFNSGELDEISTTEKYSVVQQEGNRKVTRKISIQVLKKKQLIFFTSL